MKILKFVSIWKSFSIKIVRSSSPYMSILEKWSKFQSYMNIEKNRTKNFLLLEKIN